MLDKLGGIFAPRPSAGPHKLRECLPLGIIIRNRLKYALSCREVTKVLMQKAIQVDGKVRTEPTFPAGFMDVVSIERTNEHFRLLYTAKGKFTLHRITPDEAQYKLCRVRSVQFGPKGVPFVSTHDGRTIRYPHPDIKENDTIKFNLKTKKIEDSIKFGIGNLVMITAGHNLGRVGILKTVEKHPGSHTIVHVEDLASNDFATRLDNVFVIGQGKKANVTLPRGGGIRLTPLQEQVQKNLQQKH
jgi:small subunit ribosomal protein S4e